LCHHFTADLPDLQHFAKTALRRLIPQFPDGLGQARQWHPAKKRARFFAPHIDNRRTRDCAVL